MVVTGSAEASGAADFVARVIADGWPAVVIASPAGAQWLDRDAVERVTGYPLCSEFLPPGAADVLPAASAYVVAPATFNTVNKIANGIADTLAVAAVCEGIGAGRPVVLAPWVSASLARHQAFGRSVAVLCALGVAIVQSTGLALPWDDVYAATVETLQS